MTGDEKNMATFVDSTGGLWTVTPSHVLRDHIDLTQHADEGPVTLTVPTCDAAALAGRLKTVATNELFDRFDRETDRLEVKPAQPDGLTTARLMGTPEAGSANHASIRAFVEAKGTVRERAEAAMKVWHQTYAATTASRPACDGTCGDCSDASGPAGESGEHSAVTLGEVS